MSTASKPISVDSAITRWRASASSPQTGIIGTPPA
jgi:hypothetical protein